MSNKAYFGHNPSIVSDFLSTKLNIVEGQKLHFFGRNSWPLEKSELVNKDVIASIQKKNKNGINVFYAAGNSFEVKTRHNLVLTDYSSVFTSFDLQHTVVFSINIRYTNPFYRQFKSCEENRAKALRVATAVPLQPNLIVDTGSTIQLVWQVELVYDNANQPPGTELEFSKKREICFYIRGIHSQVCALAAVEKLNVDPIITDVFPDEKFAFFCTYIMIPGMVNYLRNLSGEVTQAYPIQVVSEYLQKYTFPDFDPWVGEKYDRDALLGINRLSKKRRNKTVLYGLVEGADWDPVEIVGYPPGHFYSAARDYCAQYGIVVHREYFDYNLEAGGYLYGPTFGLSKLIKDARNQRFNEVVFLSADFHWNDDPGFREVIRELNQLGIGHRNINLWGSSKVNNSDCYRPTTMPNKWERKAMKNRSKFSSKASVAN